MEKQVKVKDIVKRLLKVKLNFDIGIITPDNEILEYIHTNECWFGCYDLKKALEYNVVEVDFKNRELIIYC